MLDTWSLVLRLGRHPVAQNTLVLYAVQVTGYLIPLITLPYLARVLSPDQFGVIAFAQNVIWYFVIVTDYGFNVTATREIAIHRDDSEKVSQIFSSVLAAKLGLTVLGFLVLLIAVFTVPQFRAEKSVFLLCYLSVAGTALFPLWLYQGLQKLQWVGIRDVAAKIITLVCLIAFVHRKTDYVLAVAIQSGGFFLSGALGLASAPYIASLRWIRPTYSEVRRVLAEGWHLFISMSAMSLYSTTNAVILGFIAPTAEVGVYSAALRLIVPIRALVGQLSTAVYPYVSRMAANEPGRAARFVNRYALLLSSPFLLVGIGLLAGGPVLARIGFGKAYAASGPLLQILAVSPFLLALSHCFATYYMLGFGYTRQWARLSFAAGVVNFGAFGIALAVARPSVAASITVVVLDVFVTLASYVFYLRTVDDHSRPLEPREGPVVNTS